MIVNATSNTDYTASRSFPDPGTGAIITQLIGWTMLAFLAVFLFNNFLTVWLDWPGIFGTQNGFSDQRSWIQAGLYVAAIVCAFGSVLRNRGRSLRSDKQRVANINSFLIRAAFWSVFLIGLIDFSLAFLRGEELLDGLMGDTFARELMRANFRGPYIHMPLIAVSIMIAALTRSIGITWLTLFIVVAELLIVMFRFVFSYEQVYMTDLVRFWYAPLFLFGCACTLREEGHVRVDVFYANFAPKTRGLVNALGTLLLGMPFCWLILIVGTSGKTGVLNSALLGFEIEGLGDGLFVLYLMTVFMGVFAVSMLIEFVSFLFDAVADYYEETGFCGHDKNCPVTINLEANP